MKIKIEWNEEPELFDALTDALLDEPELEVSFDTSASGYGDEGTIELRHNGRRFQLDLHEIVY